MEMCRMTLRCYNTCPLDNNLYRRVKLKSIDLCSVLCLKITQRYTVITAGVVKRRQGSPGKIIGENALTLVEIMCLKQSHRWHHKANVVDVFNGLGSVNTRGTWVYANSYSEK